MTKRPVRRTDCVSAKGQFLVGHVKNSSLLNCRTFFILCLEDKNSRDAVSYTHLDVYKRQIYSHAGTPDLEVYFEGDNSASDYRCEVWVPVVKK